MATDRTAIVSTGIALIGVIEVVIGFGSLCAVTAFHFLAIAVKPLNVLIFVLASSLTSIVLGYGILARRSWARTLLVFFAGYVALTKVLLAADLLTLNGAIAAGIPSWLTNATSFIYHVTLIVILERKACKERFR